MPCEQGVQIPSMLIYQAIVKRFSNDVAVATSFVENAMHKVRRTASVAVNVRKNDPINFP
jgi:hypothetical protein